MSGERQQDGSAAGAMPGSRSVATSCCGVPVALALPATQPEFVRPVAETARAVDVDAYVREENGLHRLDLMIEGIHCGGCVATIERTARSIPGMVEARVNMTTRRMSLGWRGPTAMAGELVGRLSGLGYRAVPYDPARLRGSDEAEEKALLRAMAVAGFAAANVMLLSVSIWAGHAQGMAEATRDLLHWFSALVVLPAIAYAGRPFFASAFQALRHGRTHMDVPITIGVVLAAGISLFETVRGGAHAYFESAIMLVFFLLIGRYLDRRARRQARSSAERLLALSAQAVTVIGETGHVVLPADRVLPGMVALVAAGEKIGVDGTVIEGASDLDAGIITGESLPLSTGVGAQVHAGAINLTAPLKIRVSAAGDGTLLAGIVRLMEAAEAKKARFVALADRVARLYAPVVHVLAAATFLAWWLVLGLAWQPALLIAVSVLIITCPCALGLAVPAVQVIASSRLVRQGVLVKSGTALEQAAAADTVVFDKTGTLTLGRPRLVEGGGNRAALRLAAGLAANSRHPLAQALVAKAGPVLPADGVEEVPGRGLRRPVSGGEIRLGSRAFCGVAEDPAAPAGPELWLTRPGAAPSRFGFADTERPDAQAVVTGLRQRGCRVILLSGDRRATVADMADRLGIAEWHADCRPDEKVRHLEALAAAGGRVMMVGDGLNDAPALAAAAVSLSPTSAADISQNAADIVFQGERLSPVLTVVDTARRARRLITQNLVLAIGYNAVTVPLAVAGLVTPLIAAAAMSASSIVVVLNALRLARGRG
ncbi:MAG: heavy metal translocating P-type ATPase [Azospirillaceae bacterium]